MTFFPTMTKQSPKGKKKSPDSFFVLIWNTYITHSVHALNYTLAKLITGFGLEMEHYVGEEPKSEANCYGRKRVLFTGEVAVNVEAQKYTDNQKEQKRGKKTDFSFLVTFTAPLLSVSMFHMLS